MNSRILFYHPILTKLILNLLVILFHKIRILVKGPDAASQIKRRGGDELTGLVIKYQNLLSPGVKKIETVDAKTAQKPQFQSMSGAIAGGILKKFYAN